ncbi:DUF2079 domain-containing protein [Amycolatopsis sp. AA4]|uniref:hypothetical protein n=1 Tax=Actinomycetes TaxID=1760 RepID=UPI0001B545C4|nr:MULTISPECIES: hypothetical protein [Actinomycetes]ATY13465.1 DUF2079 domain-containing protein [Amycolatopsis sp. AA4]EFL09411.1 predicted protein [Streptomyces sp. AA4]
MTALASPAVALPAARRSRAGVVALAAFAAVPAVLALWTALRAPRAHVLLDYWHVLAKITDDQGHLVLGQVLTYHLDQPFVIPSLLFYADAAWFGGDNRVLTVLTVALVAGIGACLYSMLPASLSPQRKAALAAGMSWLLFSSHLAEIWLQGTNGISWIPAVFFSVLAAAQAHRGRVWTAAVAALLASLSFGAGLPAFFLVAAIFLLRRENRTKTIATAAAGTIVMAGWLLTKPSGAQSLATTALDPDGRLSVAAAALGSLWTGDQAAIAVLAGALTTALLTACAIAATTDPRAAGWIGIAGYAAALAVLVALGRTSNLAPGGNIGLISRYAIVSALALTALLVLATLVRPQWPLTAVVIGVCAISLTTHALGGTKADLTRRGYAPLALAPIALRTESAGVLDQLHIQPQVIPAATALGAYPFNPRFTLGCHGPELGATINTDTATDLPAAHGGLTSTGSALITGWTDLHPDCVLVTDSANVVIGGGITGLPSPAPGIPDGNAWQATARPGAGPVTVYALQNNRLYRLHEAAPSSG